MLPQALGTGTTLIIPVTVTPEHRGMSRKITTLSQSPKKVNLWGQIPISPKPDTPRLVGLYEISPTASLSGAFPFQGVGDLSRLGRKWVSERSGQLFTVCQITGACLGISGILSSILLQDPSLLINVHSNDIAHKSHLLTCIIFLQKRCSCLSSVFQLS